MKLGDSMDKKLFKSILLLITYTVVLVMVLSRLGLIAGGVAWVLGLVKPLLIGFALAFVLNRPCHFFFRLYDRGLSRTRARGAARPLAVVTSYLVLILAIAAIFSFVVPKLVESIQTFALNLGGYLANVQGWYNDIIAYFHLDVEALDLSGLNDVLKNLFNYVLGFRGALPGLLHLYALRQGHPHEPVPPGAAGLCARPVCRPPHRCGPPDGRHLHPLRHRAAH